MNYNPYDPQQPYDPQAPESPQAPQQPQYQAPQPQYPPQYQPQQPQYAPQQPQQPQYAPQQPQYQPQPRPVQYAPRPQQPVRQKSGSDGALLVFVLIYFFTNLTIITIQETSRLTSTARNIIGVFMEIMTLSLLLIPFGFKSTGMKVTSFILLGMMVIYFFLRNLMYFGVYIF